MSRKSSISKVLGGPHKGCTAVSFKNYTTNTFKSAHALRISTLRQVFSSSPSKALRSFYLDHSSVSTADSDSDPDLIIKTFEYIPFDLWRQAGFIDVWWF